MTPCRLSAVALKDHPAHYLALVQSGLAVRSHVDLLHWLQGDVQNYLPHEILITGWGTFDEGAVQHDVVSRLPGVRSYAEGTACLPFLLAKINDCWVAGGRQPRIFPFSAFSYLLGSDALPNSFGEALRRMGSAVVHGISDQRGQNECVYVFLSADAPQSAGSDAALSAAAEMLLPSIDTALRQISHLPAQRGLAAQPLAPKPASEDGTGLSDRETQIMAWVAMGKTNSEIGSILNISGFTVKNHMQRIFQKLNVFNRAQAVSKVTRVSLDV